MIDIAVIGAGPAGYSAAITARKRDQSVVVIGQNTGWLARAEHVANYPGLPDISGRDLLSAMANQAQALGAELRPGVVHQVIAMGDSFALSLGADFIEARRVILCTGAKQPKLLPGENELLGRGVSYCGTCDGMLYRGRRVAVIAQGPEAVSEANFLAGLCREVVYFGKPEDALDPRIVVSGQKPEAILGEASVSGLRAGGEDLPFDGVFIFREAAALSALLPGLEMDGAFIRVDRRMQTNLPGVFAAGDCTGLPLQVAKAVGEGCVAAISAATALVARAVGTVRITQHPFLKLRPIPLVINSRSIFCRPKAVLRRAVSRICPAGKTARPVTACRVSRRITCRQTCFRRFAAGTPVPEPHRCLPVFDCRPPDAPAVGVIKIDKRRRIDFQPLSRNKRLHFRRRRPLKNWQRNFPFRK